MLFQTWVSNLALFFVYFFVLFSLRLSQVTYPTTLEQAYFVHFRLARFAVHLIIAYAPKLK